MKKNKKCPLAQLFGLLLLISINILAQSNVSTIDPLITTQPMLGNGDRADDPCVWIHPNRTENSIVIGVNKSNLQFGGLYAFDLKGKSIADTDWIENINLFEKGERYNNVDIKYNFKADNENWDIICASNRSDEEIDVFKVNTTSEGDFKNLEKVGEIPLGSGFISDGDAPYGLAMFHHKKKNLHYVLISDKAGKVAQYRLDFNIDGIGENQIIGQRVTNIIDVSKNDTEVEGIVADDEKSVIYIAAEDRGIYRYPTNENGVLIDQRITVATIQNNTNLSADLEGLSIYYASSGEGYLLASVQGKNQYAIYERSFEINQPNSYIKSFALTDVQNTDGIDVTNVNLGGDFNTGIFLAHDGIEDRITRYKLVPWKDIAGAGTITLQIDTSYNPRALNYQNEETLSGNFVLTNNEFKTLLDGDEDDTVEQSNNVGISKQWEFTNQFGNVYKIKNVKFNKWLSATTDGTVFLSSNSNSPNEEWRVEKLSPSIFTLKNIDTNKYLDADDDGSVGLSNTPKMDDEWIFESINTLRLNSFQSQIVTQIFPNPADDNFKIVGLPLDVKSIEIHNLNGQLIYRADKSMLQKMSEIVVETASLPEGIYIVNLKTESNKTVTQNILINH